MKISSSFLSTTTAFLCIFSLTACNNRQIASQMDAIGCKLNLGSCQSQLPALDDFLGKYDEAIERNPQDAKAYYERAVEKRYNPRILDEKGALADLDRSISLNPTLALAYHQRGHLKARSQNFQGALADYNLAISLDDRSPKSGIETADEIAYYYRASVKDRLGDAQGALADYDKYIALNPKSPPAYKLRAALKADELQDFQGALADYQQALALSDNNIISNAFGANRDDDISGMHHERQAYENRDKLQAQKLKNPQAALTYYDKLIQLSAKSEDVLYEHIYIRRADLKADRLNDLRGALADYDRAIELSPKESFYYQDRAEFKIDHLKDDRSALADYDRAIEVEIDREPESKLKALYLARGKLKYVQLNDRAGGIADLKQVLQLAKKDNDTKVSNLAIAQLKSWGKKSE